MHMTFSSPLQLRAQGSETLPTRFEGIAYSGSLIPGRNIVVDLGSTVVIGPMQLLCEHDHGACAGLIEKAVNDGKQIMVEGRLFSDLKEQQGARIAERAKRGAPYQLSVGLFNCVEEYIGRGQNVVVNGRVFTGPLEILRNGKVREVSIVAVGADEHAKVRVFNGGQRAHMLDAKEIYRRRNSGYWC